MPNMGMISLDINVTHGHNFIYLFAKQGTITTLTVI